MSPINRRDFITAAVAAATVSAATPGFSQRQSRRPNILFILADDLGYGDLSCYGRPDYQTPNLDRLAAQGVRLTNAYSASPLCTPSRCAFITGRYPARTKIGLEEPLHERRAMGDRALTLGLPPDHPTIASLLKSSGYETALIGKWHLGYLPTFGPMQSGFDEFFGNMSGAVDFFTHKDMEGDLDLYEGKVPVERIGYMTEMLTARAVEYIKKRAVKNTRETGSSGDDAKVRPFYLSLHYTAPHWPWEAPGDRPPAPELRGPNAFRAGGSLKTYASMMKSLDDGIGEVLRALAQSGLERDTLVIFTSDNGGERFSYHWPFAGQKGSLLEGGIRVPAIVRWPAGGITRWAARAESTPAMRSVPEAVATGSQLESNVQRPMSKADAVPTRSYASAFTTDDTRHPAPDTLIDTPCISMDWTATILAAAQAKPDPNYPLDGIDLLPILRRTGTRHPSPVTQIRTFFWRHANQDAALRGPWKYFNDGTREYLFNLSIDEREQANFRDQNPEIFKELQTVFKAWESTVLPRPPARTT